MLEVLYCTYKSVVVGMDRLKDLGESCQSGSEPRNPDDLIGVVFFGNGLAHVHVRNRGCWFSVFIRGGDLRKNS